MKGTITPARMSASLSSLDHLVVPLHEAVWTNDLATVRSILLHEPSLVNSVDEESGWTPLHKAFYFGRICIAALLLMNGASKVIEDRQGKTPVDLIVAKESEGVDEGRRLGTEVLAWGNGANYQLGMGSADLVEGPKRVGWLHGIAVRKLGASKFHTVALGEAWEVYTWGWGRGGRLGHPDGSLATKEGAQIYPRKVQGLSGKVIVDVAAAKHHTLAVTDVGEVYSWGSNRDGKLGYSSKDTQVVPKKVMSLKGVHVGKVSAANRHSVAIADHGLVYTWGANTYGQLGYGTSDSASNPTPIVVESIRKKSICGISASKHHTLVVTTDGEVYSWGHKCVNPRPLHFHRYRASHYTASGEEMHFHRGYEEVNLPFIEKVAAGVVHSSCITKGGRVLVWNSRDPNLEVVAVGGALTGKKAVSLAASKLVTAVVGSSGEVYRWEAKKKEVGPMSGNGEDAVGPVISQRILDVTAVTDVWVGEKHTVVLQCWKKSCQPAASEQEQVDSNNEETLENASNKRSTQDSMSLVVPGESLPDAAGSFGCLASNFENEDSPKCSILSLQILCQAAVASHVLEPRNAMHMLRYADSVGAEILRKHSLQVVLYNLGVIAAEASSSLVDAPSYILSEIETIYQSEVLGMRHGPGGAAWWLDPEGYFDESTFGKRPTARACNSNEQCFDVGRVGQPPLRSLALNNEHSHLGNTEHCFMVDRRPTEAELGAKLIRNVKKKLQQISNLETKQAEGAALDEQQIFKISRRQVLSDALYHLLAGSSVTTVQSILASDFQLELSGQDEIFGSSLNSVTGHSWASDSCNVKKVSSSKKSKKKAISPQSKGKPSRSEESKEEVLTKKVEAIRSVGFSVASDTGIKVTKKSKQTGLKGKKGALSAFLSGELEKKHQIEETQETACSGPVWGKQPTEPSEVKLTDIMHQQETTVKSFRTNKEIAVISKTPSRNSAPKVSLFDFMTKPQVTRKSGPAWGGIGATPPSSAKPSLQDIQVEQGSRRPRWPHSARSNVAAPLSTTAPSRWYTPDDDHVVQGMREIQIEEKAAQEIGKLYKGATVKFVNGSASGHSKNRVDKNSQT